MSVGDLTRVNHCIPPYAIPFYVKKDIFVITRITTSSEIDEIKFILFYVKSVTNNDGVEYGPLFENELVKLI